MKKYIILLSTILLIIINGLGASGVLGISMADLSKIFPFGFMPPAIVFMVSWALIYFLQFYYIFLIFKNKNELEKNEFYLNLGVIYSNIFWMIFTTQGFYIISAFFIIFMYIFLFLLCKNFYKKDLKKEIIFGIYLGWITTATFLVTVGQLTYLFDKNLALSNNFAIFTISLGIFANIITYFFTKNKIAIFWGILAIIITGLKYF